MPKSRFWQELRPDPAGGAYSARPDPLAIFKGPTSKGKAGQGRRGEEGKGKEGTGGEKVEEKREGKGREGVIPVLLFPHFEPCQDGKIFTR